MRHLPYPETSIQKTGPHRYQICGPESSITLEIQNPKLERALDAFNKDNISNGLQSFWESLAKLSFTFHIDENVCTEHDLNIEIPSTAGIDIVDRMHAQSPWKIAKDCPQGMRPKAQNFTFPFHPANGKDLSPRTAYTMARYVRSIQRQAFSKLPNIDQALREKLQQNPTNTRAASYILQQHYAVTSMCAEALAPACKNPSPAQSEIIAFRNSEKNHDKLIRKSLETLGVRLKTIDDVEVSEPVFQMMSLLRESGTRHPFVFALMAESFEGNAYSSASKSLGDTLGQFSSTKAAAEGLLKHHRINEEGDHAQIALQIISGYESISIQTLRESLAHLSLLTRIQLEFKKSLLRVIASPESA